MPPPTPAPPRLGICNNKYQDFTFLTYANTSGSNDCTLATIADFQRLTLGTTLSEPEVAADWQLLDPDNTGVTNNQALSFWKTNGLGGVYLNSATQLPIDPETIKSTLDNPATPAIIAALAFKSGQNFAGNSMTHSSYHWAVIDGYTPAGPLVVTWGQTLQMSWQQWNLEATAAWTATTQFTPNPQSGATLPGPLPSLVVAPLPTPVPPSPLPIPTAFLTLNPTIAKKAVKAANIALAQGASKTYTKDSLSFIATLWGSKTTQYPASTWVQHLLPFNALVQNKNPPPLGSVLYFQIGQNGGDYTAGLYLGGGKVIYLDPELKMVVSSTLEYLQPVGWSKYILK